MKCPVCGDEIRAPRKGAPIPPHFPFCTERCQMIDLGNWFREKYKVSRPLGPEDVPDSYEPEAEQD